jgi:Holliday junction resolvase RusA-like endonuclease
VDSDQERIVIAEALSFWVGGVPVQQGSKTVFNGRAVDSNQKLLRPWRAKVADAARAANAGRDPLDGPVLVVLEFRFVRPKSVKRAHPTVKPDLDKLARAVLDSLTTARVYKDDAQVVSLWPTKVYGAEPGVRVRVGHP